MKLNDRQNKEIDNIILVCTDRMDRIIDIDYLKALIARMIDIERCEAVIEYLQQKKQSK